LRKLNEQLQAALDTLEEQKGNSQRWMQQQRSRMVLQAQETLPSRLPMADYYLSLIKLLQLYSNVSQHQG
jgi:hypothetical protein